MTVFASSAQARTFDYQAGDIGESSRFAQSKFIYSVILVLIGYVPASFGMMSRIYEATPC